MAVREHYSSAIKCPSCNQKGILHLSEEDQPYKNRPDRNVDKVDGGFTAVVLQGLTVSIVCQTCQEAFNYK